MNQNDVFNSIALQKLACRIITSMPPRTSSALLFTMLNFLNSNAIYKQCVLVMLYKFNTGMLLDVLNNMFTRTNTIHNIATRQTDKLHVHFCKLNDVEGDTAQRGEVVEQFT